MSRKYTPILVFVLLLCFGRRGYTAEFTQWESNPDERTDYSTYVIYTQTADQSTQGNTIICYLDTSCSGVPPMNDSIEIWLKDEYGDNIAGYLLCSIDKDGNALQDTGGISKSIYLLAESRINSVEVTLDAINATPILNTAF